MSAILNFRRTGSTDWLHQKEFEDTIPADQPGRVHWRTCPPCDGMCGQVRDCPRDADLPCTTAETAYLVTAMIVGFFALLIGLVGLWHVIARWVA